MGAPLTPIQTTRVIRTVADLLDAFIAKESAVLTAFRNLEHGPLTGEMYEGLTKEVLRRSIFDDLNLRVASGKVDKGDGLSDQIDCMLVEGEGQPIPYTLHGIFQPSQVLAVIEVKKNLYGGDLASAHDNLVSTESQLEENISFDFRSVQGPFRLIARSDLPPLDRLYEAPGGEQALAFNLVRDVLRPVRIMFGYRGFASEKALRNAFITYIEGQLSGPRESRRRLSPASLPSLVLCGRLALVKLNGMPYAARLESDLPYDTLWGRDRWWPLFGSARGQNAIMFLEVLWSRIATRFGLKPSIFGDDLDLEPSNVLLLGKPIDDKGWVYVEHPLSEEQLAGAPKTKSWEPVELTLAQFVVIQILCQHESVSIGSPEFQKHAAQASQSVSEFVEGLVRTGLVFLSPQRKLRLLTFSCQSAILSDGRFVAGENETGRFTAWVNREFERAGRT